MKIFISWSGIRSKYVADSLRNWIPKVLQAVKPWMSDEDISTGARWSAEIASELEGTKVGIVCLTPENQHNPWVMFEAGALSKTLSDTFVCPYLYDLSPAQLSGPMTQFQATLASKDGTAKIIQTLNKALGNYQITALELDEIFDVWWPKLEKQLNGVPDTNIGVVATRPTEDILEEILGNTREQMRREEIRLAALQEREIKLDGLYKMLEGWANLYKGYRGIFDNLSKELTGLREDGTVDLSCESKRAYRFLKLLEMNDMGNIKDLLGQQQVPDLNEMLRTMKEIFDDSKEETNKLLKLDSDT